MKILLFVALLLSAPAALAQDAAAPPADRDPRPARMEARHPAFVLLQHRDSLALSPGQVRELERIHARFAARNRELWAVVRAPERMEREEEDAARRSASAQPPSREHREVVRRAQEAARQAQAQLRENQASTAQEALAVLSPEQRARFGALGGG
jgi:cobalamin biosynthesis protein CobT